MSKYTYKELLKKAEECKKNVKNKQRTIISYKWCYYFNKALITHKDVPKISIDQAPKRSSTHISRQMTSKTYLALAKKFTSFVEKHHRLPNYLRWGNYKISLRLWTYTSARCLVYYDKYGKYDKEITINEKVFTKPTETGNVVYDYASKKFNKKFTTLDGLLEYVAKYFKYEFYYDDKKSNKQVTDSKAGNCTDLLQWVWNMAEAMGYDVKCLHVECSSGVGHVRGMFRHAKHTGGEWIYRDIACVASDGNIRCNWCTSGSELLAINPPWFMENLHR